MSVFTSFNVKKKNTLQYYSHTVPCCRTSIHPLPERSVLAPVSLRLNKKAWSALIDQLSQA